MTCEDLEMAFALKDMGLRCLLESEGSETPHSVHAEAISDAICERDECLCPAADESENEPFLSDDEGDGFDDDDGVSFDLRLRSELNKSAIGMDTRHRCPGDLIRLIDRMPEKKSEMLADTLGFPFVALRQMLGHELFLVLLDFFQSDRVAFPTREQVMRRRHLVDVYEMATARHMTLPDIAHAMHTSFAHVQKCMMLVDAERKLYEKLNAPESRDGWNFDDDDAVV